MANPGVPQWPDRTEAALFLAKSLPRLRVLDLNAAGLKDKLKDDVRHGLTSLGLRRLSPAYFYDETGSELYERITALPEYYPTRAEASLLATVAPTVMRQLHPQQIVELGSGSAAKTKAFFDTPEARRGLTYVPIDVGQAMLAATATHLIADYPHLRVLGLVGRYEDAIRVLPPEPDRLILFLGSTIGNFTTDEQSHFFQSLSEHLTKGNHLLVGYDRQPHAGKPESVIVDAYNDAQGVTAAFNLNLLQRLNRELSANFRLDRWEHRAWYNREQQQIEMALESTTDQIVSITALNLRLAFRKGERILTEISRKFDPITLADWFQKHGFHTAGQWTDAEERVGLLLLQRG